MDLVIEPVKLADIIKGSVSLITPLAAASMYVASFVERFSSSFFLLYKIITPSFLLNSDSSISISLKTSSIARQTDSVLSSTSTPTSTSTSALSALAFRERPFSNELQFFDRSLDFSVQRSIFSLQSTRIDFNKRLRHRLQVDFSSFDSRQLEKSIISHSRFFRLCQSTFYFWTFRYRSIFKAFFDFSVTIFVFIDKMTRTLAVISSFKNSFVFEFSFSLFFHFFNHLLSHNHFLFRSHCSLNWHFRLYYQKS